MSETVHFEIQEGKSEHVRTIRTPINMEAMVTETLAAGATRKSAIMAQTFMGQGAVGVTIAGGGMEYWSIRINTMMINCPFEVKDGVAWPVMVGKENSEMHLNIPWTPPETMRLVLGVWMRPGFEAKKVWLIAYDPKGESYKLPLGNCFEDCGLCTGSYENFGSDTFEVLKATLDQFQSSKWNCDLFRGDDTTKRLFSFTPTDKEFKQIECPKWNENCVKLSTEATRNFFSPL